MFPVVKSIHATKLFKRLLIENLDSYALIEKSDLPAEINVDETSFLPRSSVESLISFVFESKGEVEGTRILQHVFKAHVVPSLLRGCPDSLSVRETLDWVQSSVKEQIPSSQVSLLEDEKGVWFSRYRADISADTFIWSEVYTLLLMIEIVRSLTNHSNWMPTIVRFQSPDDDRIYRCLSYPIQFFYSQNSCGIWIDEATLCGKSNEISTLNLVPENYTEETSHDVPVSHLFDVLKPYILDLDFDLNRAAKLLRLSKRTLQRRLKEEGLTFRQLRDSLIAEVAIERLKDGMPVSKVAVSLGYSSISQFSRAFKRITGISPSLVNS